MRVAILLGISEYETLGKLPSCKSDVDLMKKLLEATKRYDETLCISENTESTKVKKEITNLIKNLQSNEIEEVLFYYSGHGDFFENEFYYVLSNFKKEKRKQTSIENSEIDNWLRSLHPELTIKIIDACHSGITYVKDDESIKSYLNESGGNFKKCYFMFSSKLEQSSYQDNNLSYFTKSFAQALIEHMSVEIRYKDIIDYISDDFAGRSNQTPFFITQANYTELFCLINQEIKDLVTSFVKETISESIIDIQSSSEVENLEKIIKENAKNYISEEKVMKILEDIKELIENYKYPSEINSIFEMQHSFESYYWSVPNIDIIGTWIDQHKDKYFAEVIEEEEAYKVEVPVANYNLLFPGINYRTETRYRKIITGFNLNVDCPYKVIKIIAKPKYPNIPWSSCIILFLLSKTKIHFFYFFSNYIEKNWEEREQPRNVNWIDVELKLIEHDSIRNFLNNVQNDFLNYIINQIKEKFRVKENEERERNES